jgi:hypothetical protein
MRADGIAIGEYKQDRLAELQQQMLEAELG